MALFGPPKKSAELRILEGERAHRPLPKPGPKYAPGIPERPKGMTAAARRIWDGYVAQLAPLGVLRPVDGFALRRLCEDHALLQELQVGMGREAGYMKRQAKARLETIRRRIAELEATPESAELPALRSEVEGIERQLVKGMMNVLVETPEGRRQTATINALAGRIARAELQFGLTPVASQRLENIVAMPASASGAPRDPVEEALCG